MGSTNLQATPRGLTSVMRFVTGTGIVLVIASGCGTTRELTQTPDLNSNSPLPVKSSASEASTAEASTKLARADLTGWDTLPPLAFEALALGALPNGQATPLDEFLLAELEGALHRPGPRAVRAAVLLGRSSNRDAGEILLRRLERRVIHPGRNQDAADVVAAGALERMPGADWAVGRLTVLGAGPIPHPDLEVRVACAAAALLHGRDEVTPFLLQVLRIGTPDGAGVELDFNSTDRSTWSRT
ncbi:MAG: hypothetical protein ACI8QS_003213, partial [Planctomycetota bacterium]